jgi:hypothetical protein
MSALLRALLLTPLLCGISAMAQPPDLAFVKQEPYRKSKQAIDTTTIKTAQDARVIEEAIVPIMRLLVGLTFARLPPAVDKDVMTEQGRQSLRQPPLRNDKKRYSFRSIGNWKVCGTDSLSFSAVYEDLFRQNPWPVSFIFRKEDDGWRFQGHGELPADCKQPE